MVHERLAMAARFGRHLAMVKVVSGEASAAAVTTVGSPPSNNLAREGSVHQVIGTSLVGTGG
jgi:hypothetical protein